MTRKRVGLGRVVSFAGVACVLALAAGCGTRPPEEPKEPEPPEVVTPEPPVAPEPQKPPAPAVKRGRVCLNGRWRFCPATGPAYEAPTGEWGTIFVPGSWSFSDWPPVQITADEPEPGTGPALEDIRGQNVHVWRQKTPRAWYEHSFRVPARWDGRHIELDFYRVSTDAVVWVNGKECGKVFWPTGTVDVTEAVTPGEEARLRVLVIATPNEGDVATYMGTAERQVLKQEAKLDARGIIGDVFLSCRPHGAHVSDVFVRTSTREKTITLDVELSGVEEAGEVEMVARMLDEEGQEERSFTSSARAARADAQRVEASWDWPDARLWDFAQPNLYTLKLEVKGCGLDDAYEQRFGFREFRVEGKGFVLNEKPIRLRPTLQGAEGGNVQQMDAGIDEAFEAGFNIAMLRDELWPNGMHRRGTLCYVDLIAERADAKGWPITGIAQNMNDFVSRGWDKPGVKEEYELVMRAQLRRWRNHPSIVMWGTSGNFFGHVQDQDPRVIGRRGWADDDKWWRERADAGEEGVAIIKRFDPTRPVFTHHGAYVGDVHTVNCYLDMIPLQEREEWLSEWAATGEIPFCPIEFGTPLHVTFNRGRDGFGNSQASEPLVTEFCAIYQGSKAYEWESEGYRREIAARFQGGQKYDGWQGNRHFEGQRNFLELQVLFLRNTWRSWRTWGITGGMLPWHYVYRERVPGTGREEDVALVAGSRGTYERKRTVGADYRITSRGEVLKEVNSDTLAWIAGAKGAFTSKDHHFYVGEKVSKQVVLVNDSRAEQPYEAAWKVRVAGREVSSGGKKGRIGVARSVLLPVAFKAPAVAQKSDGTIRLEARIGGAVHTDVFVFRAYPRPKQARGRTVIAVDPEGATSKMLASVGVEARRWEGEFGVSAPVLVVGRRALDEGRDLPGSLEQFVASGGRAVMFAQDPEWFRKKMGFRVARHVSRRAWPVVTMKDNPIAEGLDGEDLRDWRGGGTLVEPRPDHLKTDRPADHVEIGWRWGNTGSVTSAAIEKPHHAGWRPVIECEFDLAYTPLMELHFGDGLFVICTLDLEGRVGVEPVADMLARRIIDYAAEAALEPRARATYYLGAAEGESFLKQIGLVYRKTASVPGGPALLVIGPDAVPVDTHLERFMAQGGNVFFMAREAGVLPLGFSAETKGAFVGSLEPAGWPEARGLSASDTRLRVEVAAAPLADGPGEVASDGLLGRIEHKAGKAVFMQLLPTSLNAAKETFLRYSQWRVTRANVQVLAGLGGEFLGDVRSFRWGRSLFDPIPLAGNWRCQVEKRLSPVQDGEKAHVDTGNTGEAEGWHESGLDDSDWATARVPGPWEESAAKFDGAVWFRKDVELPDEWAGGEALLELGAIDDFDVTFVNGVRVGSVDNRTPEFWLFKRRYEVAAGLLKAGRNVIAVRVFDHFGSGGFGGDRSEMKLSLTGTDRTVPLAGDWKFRISLRLEPSPSPQKTHPDPGILGHARGWSAPDLDESGWGTVALPSYWEAALFDIDGAVWFRKEVLLPRSWLGRDIVLGLGRISDRDVAYFNGKRVGATGGAGEDASHVRRLYVLPAREVREGVNVVTVRIFDSHGEGGFVGEAREMTMSVAGLPETQDVYYPGFRTDFAYGDDPYRYYRW